MTLSSEHRGADYLGTRPPAPWDFSLPLAGVTTRGRHRVELVRTAEPETREHLSPVRETALAARADRGAGYHIPRVYRGRPREGRPARTPDNRIERQTARKRAGRDFCTIYVQKSSPVVKGADSMVHVYIA